MCSLVVVAVCEACELKKPSEGVGERSAGSFGLLFCRIGGCELTIASTSCH